LLLLVSLWAAAVFPASAHIFTPTNNNGNIHEQKITPLGMSAAASSSSPTPCRAGLETNP